MPRKLFAIVKDHKVFCDDLDMTVHTNVIGLARSCLALSLLVNLVFTDTYVYFPNPETINSLPLGLTNFFSLFGPENTQLSIIAASIVLIMVMIGYLPQVTGLLHAWIAMSFFSSSVLIEGGDQIAQIISILLIPVTLTDRRLNHWHANTFFNYNFPKIINFFSYSCLLVIRIQIAIIYFFAAAIKLNKNFWIDGTAFYYWFTNKPFGASESISTLFLPMISNHYVASLISWGAILIEILLFSALFNQIKYRPYYFMLGVIFHFLIICIHGLWAFFFAMVGGLIIYLLPWNRSLNFKLSRIKIKRI